MAGAVTKVYDFSNDGPSAAQLGAEWWNPEEVQPEDCGPSMVAAAKAIESSSQEQLRYDLNLLYGSLYEGRELANLYQYGGRATLAGLSAGLYGNGADITWNVIRSVVQTVASQVSRSRPRARFITTGGDYKQKRKAKNLTKFCDGLFNEARVYEKTQLAFLQAGAFDAVGIHVHREKDRVRVDLVRSCEILIGANDGIDGKQRTIYRRKYVDKNVLLTMVGKGKDAEKQRKAIQAASTADPVGDGGKTNLVEVYEAWHLRSSKTAKDGWYAMAIAGEDGLLERREYTRDYHEILLFSIDPALSGPYGQSPAAVLLPIQVSINTGLDKIAKGHHLQAVPRTWVHVNSKINKAAITNAPAGTYYYSGTAGPPKSETAVAFNPETYEHLERHYERAFSLYGVSAQVAAGQKESGVTSAVAIRESLDVQTARFAVLSQRWEQLHLDIARAMVDTAREIYLDNKEYQVSAPGTALLEEINWSDVNMEEDGYVIQLYPTSLLPQTPQGRIDRVNELVGAGIWSEKRGEAVLDDLDPESNVSMERAAEQDVERMCEEMLEDGHYEGPDVTMDLNACLEKAAQYISWGRQQKAPEKHLDLLYRFLDDTAELQKMLTPPAPPQQMAA